MLMLTVFREDSHKSASRVSWNAAFPNESKPPAGLLVFLKIGLAPHELIFFNST